jgi:hypothetical protein
MKQKKLDNLHTNFKLKSIINWNKKNYLPES